jgi:hypothetical protein
LILVAVGVYGFCWSWIQKKKVVREHKTAVLPVNQAFDCQRQQQTLPVENINIRLERCMNGMPDQFYSEKKNEDIAICVQRLDKKPIMLPSASRRQHMQILGPTGCGKSMLAQTLIAQDLMNQRVSIFVLEPKGGDNALVYQMKYLADRLGRKAHLIDPTNPESSIILPLSGDDLDEVAEINVSAFLMYLGSEADQFYKNKQETALRMAVKAARIVKGDEATYDDLLDILRHSPHGASVRKEYIGAISDPHYSYVKRELEEYHYELAGNPKAAHYYSGLIDYLKKLTSNRYIRNILCVTPSKAGSRVISLREALNNAGVILVTTAVHTTKHLGYTIGRLYLSMLQSEIFYRMRLNEKKSPVACYVDEVQNYVNEQFAEVFEMGRSADFMVTVIHHSLEQLRQNSKRLEQSIFTNARQKIIFGGINAEDADRIAREIGQTYQLTFSYGHQHDHQDFFGRRREEGYIHIGQKEELKWVITPTEIMKLPGFDPKTGEPAQVLCLLNIDNKPSHTFGLVYPVDLNYMKPTATCDELDKTTVATLENTHTFPNSGVDYLETQETELSGDTVNFPELERDIADNEQKNRDELAQQDISQRKSEEKSQENEKSKLPQKQETDQMSDILSDVLLRTAQGRK